MTGPELIKQLTTYADAITAFALIQSIAFCFAVAQGDGFAKAVWRKHGAVAATIGLVVGTCLYCFLVTMCMVWVGRLDKTSGTTASSTVTSALLIIQITRLSLIVVAGVLSLFALWATKLDPGRVEA